MNNINPSKPVILVIAGHDPCGGAGIQADIETISALGCQAVSIITTLTSQNTRVINKVMPVAPDFVEQQLATLIEDVTPSVCKIGMIGNTELVEIITDLLTRLKIPVVLDPVMLSGSGHALTDSELIRLMIQRLFPLTTIITPNSIEARELTKTDNLDAAAASLIDYGCQSILITGTHEDTNEIINTLYQINQTPLSFKYERLPGNYHGSGCTLSSAVSAKLALGENISSAVKNSLDYTWQTLKYGIKYGKTQSHPDRFSNI